MTYKPLFACKSKTHTCVWHPTEWPWAHEKLERLAHPACHSACTPGTAGTPMKIHGILCFHLKCLPSFCLVRASLSLSSGLSTCIWRRAHMHGRHPGCILAADAREGERAANNITVIKGESRTERKDAELLISRAWLQRSALGHSVKMMWIIECISAWSTNSRWRTSPSSSSTSRTQSPCWHAPCSASCTSRLRGEWRTTLKPHKELQ